MSDPIIEPPRYKWPWVVAAAFVLAVILAVVWVRLAVVKIERERDYNAPLPGTTPAR